MRMEVGVCDLEEEAGESCAKRDWRGRMRREKNLENLNKRAQTSEEIIRAAVLRQEKPETELMAEGK